MPALRRVTLTPAPTSPTLTATSGSAGQYSILEVASHDPIELLSVAPEGDHHQLSQLNHVESVRDLNKLLPGLDNSEEVLILGDTFRLFVRKQFFLRPSFCTIVLHCDRLPVPVHQP